MLYNEEQKKRFIRETYRLFSSQENAWSVFQAIEPIEERFDRDISSVPDQDIANSLRALPDATPENANDRRFIIAKYSRWLKTSNSGRQNKSNDKTTRRINEASEPIGSPLHLQITLDHLFPNPELNGMYFIYRAYYWLAYSGLREYEAAQLEDFDFDFHRQVIHYNGKEYPVYSEAAYDLRNVCSMTTIVKNKGKKKIILHDKPRADGHLVLRSTNSDQDLMHLVSTTYRACTSRIIRRVTERDQEVGVLKSSVAYDLSYTRAFYSGIFYRWYERERIGIEPDIEKFIDEHVDQYDDQWGYQESSEEYQKKIKGKFRQNIMTRYRYWKDRFK